MWRQAAAAFAHVQPKGQVVAVVIAVVGQATMVGHQTACVGAVAAGVPALGPLAGELLDGLHAQLQVLAL